MMKGQVYILIAAIIVISLAALANIGFYNSLPVQREQTSLTSTSAIVHNINNEIVYIMKYNNSNLDDFLKFAEEYANEKNFNLTIEKEEY